MKRKIIPYNPNLKELARQLRNGSTKTEVMLWQKLKRKQMYGYDFDRQKPLDNYILDFFCYDLMLGIEVDGYSHEFLEVYNKDVVKEAKMNEFGINVLGFSDHQVLRDMENVLRAIEQYILEFERHTPNPSQEGKSYTQALEKIIQEDNELLQKLGFHLDMTTPPYLSSQDKVGIVSTAKRTEPQEIERGIAVLKSWGLNPVIGKNAFNEHSFLAGTDAERLADLQQMLDDEAIKAIFFTKGGYGTLRIIEGIDWTRFCTNPKWLVGYSDITLLHCHVHNFGIESLHAVMLQGYPKSTQESTETIRKALFGESLEYEIPLHPQNRWDGEIIEGTLVGGNLSMLYAIMGSESDIDTDGKILFIEDIDEYLYHYDRMLISLKRAGKLKGLKALIVGQMVEIKESTIPWGKNDYEITLEHFDCPVIFDFPAGHVADNRALIMGRNVKINALNDRIKLSFHG